MQIYGPYRFNSVQGPQPTNRLSQTRGPGAAATPSTAASPRDQLDISPAARAASAAASNTSGATGPETVGGDMRLDKIASIRRQIADGSYDTPEKMDLALSRLLDDLG